MKWVEIYAVRRDLKLKGQYNKSLTQQQYGNFHRLRWINIVIRSMVNVYMARLFVSNGKSHFKPGMSNVNEFCIFFSPVDRFLKTTLVRSFFGRSTYTCMLGEWTKETEWNVIELFKIWRNIRLWWCKNWNAIILSGRGQKRIHSTWLTYLWCFL